MSNTDGTLLTLEKGCELRLIQTCFAQVWRVSMQNGELIRKYHHPGGELAGGEADVAREMPLFVRNQILIQSAVALLGQANSFPHMLYSLLMGWIWGI